MRYEGFNETPSGSRVSEYGQFVFLFNIFVTNEPNSTFPMAPESCYVALSNVIFYVSQFADLEELLSKP